MRKVLLATVGLVAVLVLAGCDTGNFSIRFAVGYGGIILNTTDAGTTWSAQPSGTQEQLNGVAFGGATHGCAVGDDGTIVFTTNGTTWSPASVVPTTNDLRAVDVQWGPGTYPAWAVGAGGSILHSNDCNTWTAQNSGTTANLNGVSTCRCSGSSDWIVGDEGRILGTTDAGITWTRQASGVIVDLKAVSFVSSSTGWAVGRGTILHTTDGGVTWLPQNAHTSQVLNGVAFADSSHGYAVGGAGLILVTSDGGATWTTSVSHTMQVLRGVSTILASGTPTGDYHDAIAVGDHGTIVMTQDGGVTWSKKASGTTQILTGTA